MIIDFEKNSFLGVLMMTNEQLKKVFEKISKSQRLPVIFAGSGLAKRYTSNRFDWKELLVKCISEYNDDPSNKYKEYLEEVKYSLGIESENKFAINEKIGTLIERDFNKSYFRKEITNIAVEDHQSPLKVYIANLLSEYSLNQELMQEIELLKQLREKMLTVITTNYDTFFEDIIFTKHEKIVGQQIFRKSELGTLMKIHGCVTEPESLILTSRDYERFTKKRKVLSAKIINLFTENPVIFMGYSVSDENIKSILMDIFQCLESLDDYRSFEEQLVLVVFDKQASNPIVGTHSMLIDGVSISMTKITLCDFTPLLTEMTKLKRITKLKEIQHLKDLVYQIVDSNEGEKSKLINLVREDEDYDGDEVVVAITKMNDMVSLLGAKRIDREAIVRDIIFDDLPRLQDVRWIVEYTLPNELRGNSVVPVHKYLGKVDITLLQLDPNVVEMAEKNEEDLFNNGIRRQKQKFLEKGYESIWDIYRDQISKWKKYSYYVLYSALSTDVDELKWFLQETYEELNDETGKTYLNKMAVILDIKENKHHYRGSNS